jgi:hypothetical protein
MSRYIIHRASDVGSTSIAGDSMERDCRNKGFESKVLNDN